MKELFKKIFAIIPNQNGYGYYMETEDEYSNKSTGEYLILKFLKYEDIDAYTVDFYYVKKENWKETWKEVNSFYAPTLEALVFTNWRDIVLKEINRVKTYGPLSIMDFLGQMLKCVEKRK
jgi:hypothetical protein